MGQYHLLVNLDKKQVVHPHRIGNGLKLCEQVGWEHSTSTVLVMLLAASSGRGGGDFRTNHPLVGSWAGDRVAFVGDYAEPGDIPGTNAQVCYRSANAACYPDEEQDESYEPGWTDISPQVREMMTSEFGITYQGDGWMKIAKEESQPVQR